MTETVGPVSMVATDLGPYLKECNIYSQQDLFCFVALFVTTNIFLQI